MVTCPVTQSKNNGIKCFLPFMVPTVITILGVAYTAKILAPWVPVERSWVATQATIEQMRRDPGRCDRGRCDLARWAVYYCYYAGSTRHHGVVRAQGENDGSAPPRYKKVGDKVRVWYDPVNPSHSITEFDFQSTFFLISFAIVGAWAFSVGGHMRGEVWVHQVEAVLKKQHETGCEAGSIQWPHTRLSPVRDEGHQLTIRTSPDWHSTWLIGLMVAKLGWMFAYSLTDPRLNCSTHPVRDVLGCYGWVWGGGICLGWIMAQFCSIIEIDSRACEVRRRRFIFKKERVECLPFSDVTLELRELAGSPPGFKVLYLVSKNGSRWLVIRGCEADLPIAPEASKALADRISYLLRQGKSSAC